MLAKKVPALILFASIFASISLHAYANFQSHKPVIAKFPFLRHSSIPKKYEDTLISSVFTKVQLKEALQSFINETYKVGFLEFGDRYDAYHFHFLGDATPNGERKIYALLYHTQEHIEDLPETERERYESILYQRRSWIQWSDSLETELALNYVYDRIPENIRDDWEFFMEKFTVKGFMIDPAKFGIARVFDFGQITFFQTHCNNNEINTVIKLEVPKGSGDPGPVCVMLENDVNRNFTE